MVKGDVVKVIKGKSKGAVGEVFFLGATQYGERVGLKTADGEKVWANPDAVVPAAPVPAAPVPGGLLAMAAALESPAVTGAVAATAGNDAVAALTARVAGLELLVGKLLDKVAALEGAAGDENGVPANALFDPPFFDGDEPPPPYGE